MIGLAAGKFSSTSETNAVCLQFFNVPKSFQQTAQQDDLLFFVPLDAGQVSELVFCDNCARPQCVDTE